MTVEIALSAGASAFMAFIASFTLFYDWYNKREAPRLEWGVGMFFYGAGLIHFGLMSLVLETSVFETFLGLILNGAISFGLFLYGTLRLFDPNQTRAKLLSIGWSLCFIVGIALYGFILTTSFPIIPIIPRSVEITNLILMEWFAVEFTIPISILIAYLMFVNLRQTANISSFWISLFFFLYGILLIIWPFEEFRLIFYVGGALTTGSILVGVRELSRKKLYTQIIREAKAESAFLLDVLSHDIKGYVHGSKLLLEIETMDNRAIGTIDANLESINTLVDKVRRFRDIDQFNASKLRPLDLVDTIEKTLKKTKQSCPDCSIGYKVTVDPKVEKFEILGNEFLNDIFLNIFYNAIKHHHHRTDVFFEIIITNQPLTQSWLIEIKDNGPGIPEDIVSSLFTILDEEKKSEKGIGHLIVKKIVNWYNGKVWAKNNIVNGEITGATIDVVLPMHLSEIRKE